MLTGLINIRYINKGYTKMSKLDENTVLWLKKWAGILEEGDGRGMGRYITVYSREDLPDGKTHRKTLQLTKRRYNGMFNEDEQATLDAGETVERHIKNNNGNLVRIRYATGTGTSADLYNEAYNRSPKTKQEKSKNAANDEKEPKPRAKRAAKNLPSTYDDLPKDRSRSWKKHRKSQYKNPGKLTEEELLFLKKWSGTLTENEAEYENAYKYLNSIGNRNDKGFKITDLKQ